MAAGVAGAGAADCMAPASTEAASTAMVWARMDLCIRAAADLVAAPCVAASAVAASMAVGSTEAAVTAANRDACPLSLPHSHWEWGFFVTVTRCCRQDQRPSRSRVASRSGRPACRIRSCASRRLYGTRYHVSSIRTSS